MRSSESEVGVYAAPSRHVDSRSLNATVATISVHVHSCTPEGKRRAALSLSLRSFQPPTVVFSTPSVSARDTYAISPLSVPFHRSFSTPKLHLSVLF